ncbi:hypothetical protein [Saccharothrix deserti]|uniref:hypothetical protein n=1 Tax=Saccharothrix deserti TaxID=2593674 RepID=UPI0030844FDF
MPLPCAVNAWTASWRLFVRTTRAGLLRPFGVGRFGELDGIRLARDPGWDLRLTVKAAVMGGDGLLHVSGQAANVAASRSSNTSTGRRVSMSIRTVP